MQLKPVNCATFF